MFCISLLLTCKIQSPSNFSIRLDTEPLVQRLGHVDQSLVDGPIVDAQGLGGLGSLEDVDVGIDLFSLRGISLGDVVPVREGFVEGLRDQDGYNVEGKVER
jgi:hypothetical protein